MEPTEQVLQFELNGWIQQMQNALAELHKGQGTSDEQEENKELQEFSLSSKYKNGECSPLTESNHTTER